ncbi:hypothetical protein F5887DRAFT_1196839 [Amanita rubescens]|nr:hypothetical protein F5887DRAFT_1196839 [Amanita rubescens]
MSDKACWTEKEEEAFLLYLLDHKSEAGDGANFTNPVWQGVALHLQPLLQRGGAKVAKSCISKWTNMRKTFRVIQALKQVSGWTWNDSTGCSITVDNAASWEAYVEKHPAAKPFKNKGWKHLHVMSQIMPAVLTGAHVFSASHGTIGIGEAMVPASQPETQLQGVGNDSQPSTPSPVATQPLQPSVPTQGSVSQPRSSQKHSASTFGSSAK